MISDAPGLSTVHTGPLRPPAKVHYYENGTLSGVRCHRTSGHRPGDRVIGGRRGAILTFSRASRLRLLKFLACLDQKSNQLPLFLTLTYPDSFPDDPKVWKSQLAAWRRRLERKWGRPGCIVRTELQVRKSGNSAGQVAPHFHLLVFLSGVELHEFRAWLSLSWYEVVASGDENHLAAGTSCTKTRGWGQVRGYLSKYVAKLETLQSHGGNTAEVPPTVPRGIGRHYALWWTENLSYKLRRVDISYEDGFRVHRWYRRLSGVKVRAGRNFECFVNASTTQRLLAFLGYDPCPTEDRTPGGARAPAVAGARPPVAGPRVGAGRPSGSPVGRG